MTLRARLPGLTTQIVLAFVAAVFSGLFFGELIAPVKLLGDIFIGLLQMTVLPYILMSLIGGLGRLSYADIRLMAIKGGGFMLLFWLIGLLVIASTSIALPDWESATFFSSSITEPLQPMDVVGLYIPSNPFFALSSSIIPAVVVFAVAIGLAVVGIPGKLAFLDNVSVLTESLMRIAGFVARLAPIGVFGLVAAAAGTMDIAELGRLQVYILTYIGASLVLSFWVLPGLVATLTPFTYRQVLAASREALVTAFATGSLLIVLPLLSERLKQLFAEHGRGSHDTDGAIDLVVPINFNFPNLGKLMALSFVLFAGWQAGAPISTERYPEFLVSGLFSFFGEVVVALPFLLDLMRIPADMFQLFVAVDIFTGRFGTLLAGVHTVALAILTAASVGGITQFRLLPLLRYAVVSVLALLALFLGLRYFFDHLVPQSYQEYENFMSMTHALEDVRYREVPVTGLDPLIQQPGQGRVDALQARGTLRVGYLKDSLPFVHRNGYGQLTGLEVDLVDLLAHDMGVRLELVRVTRKTMSEQLQSGRIDMLAAGLLIIPGRTLEMQFSTPYLNTTMALVAPDHERDRFTTIDRITSQSGLKIAALNLPYYVNLMERYFPNVDMVTIRSPRQFFKAEPGTFDALLYSAEGGSAWTLVYPSFSVVVPKPNHGSASLALGLPLGAPQLQTFVDAWLLLKKQEGFIDELSRYWIHGQGAKRREPRWSIMRNVLGWEPADPTPSPALAK
jgi:Na+/H+-dicarboxylate symporter